MTQIARPLAFLFLLAASSAALPATAATGWLTTEGLHPLLAARRELVDRGLPAPETRFRLAVLLVDFPDAPGLRQPADFNEFFFSEGTYRVTPNGAPTVGSVREYFNEVSYGTFKLEGTVLPWTHLDQPASAYTVETLGPAALAASGIDRTQWDGIAILSAAGADHGNRGEFGGQLFWVPEVGAGGDIVSITVVVHEFLHVLGLWDAYSAWGRSLGRWDPMAAGAVGITPAHPTAISKMRLGWIQPQVVGRGHHHLALPPFATTPAAYLVLAERSFFLVENRLRFGFDQGLPADGLLVWRIDPRAESALFNTGLNGQPAFVSLTTIDDPEGAQPFPGSAGRTSFDCTTTPSSHDVDGSCSVALSEISAPTGSTATFSADVTWRTGVGITVDRVGDYPTLFTAINSAGPGAVVHAPPGNYAELVRLVPDVTVAGAGAGVSVIRSNEPTAMRSVVGAAHSTLTGFSIAGTGFRSPNYLGYLSRGDGWTVSNCAIRDFDVLLADYGVPTSAVVRNNAFDGGGTALLTNLAGPRLRNNVFLGNGQAINSGAVPDAAFNAFFANGVDFAGPGVHGDGDLTVDPLFVSAPTGDYRLQAGSPCIDAGDVTLLDSDGSRSDIGPWGGPGAPPSSPPTASPPNLVVMSLTSPPSVVVGGTLHVTATVASVWADVADFCLDTYLSTDGYRNAEDVRIDRACGLAATGAPTTFSRDIPIPLTLGGNWTLLVEADGAHAILETDEGDNVRSAPLEIVPPDLRIDSIVPPPNIAAGVLAPFAVTITSARAASGAFCVELREGAYAAFSGDEVLLDRRCGLSLPADGSLTYTATVLPTRMLSGSYFFVRVDPDGAVQESDESNNLRFVYQYVNGTNLTAVGVTAPASAVSGSLIDVGISLGTWWGASQFCVDVVLSADPVITAEDALLKRVCGLAMVESTPLDLAWSVALPPALSGTWYVGVLADSTNVVPELVEGDNSASTPITIVPPPDLQPETITVWAPLQAGATAEVTIGTRNASDTDAAAYCVDLYLSTDAAITTSDRKVARACGLPGAARTQVYPRVQFTVPFDVSGAWYLGMVVDPDGLVAESNEANNTWTMPVTVAPAPDLAIAGLAAPATAGMGSTISISGQATAALGPATGFCVAAYLSPDATITAADTRLGEQCGLSAAPGAPATVNLSVALPAGVSGAYWIGLLADSAGTVAETNEANNTAAKAVAISPLDLTMTAVSGPSTGTNGKTISVSNTIKATGAAASNACVGLYLSSDATITTADRYLGQRCVASLAAGASSAASTTVTLPAGVKGTFFLGAIADPSNALAETNEANNARAAASTILVK